MQPARLQYCRLSRHHVITRLSKCDDNPMTVLSVQYGSSSSDSAVLSMKRPDGASDCEDLCCSCQWTVGHVAVRAVILKALDSRQNILRPADTCHECVARKWWCKAVIKRHICITNQWMRCSCEPTRMVWLAVFRNETRDILNHGLRALVHTYCIYCEHSTSPPSSALLCELLSHTKAYRSLEARRYSLFNLEVRTFT